MSYVQRVNAKGYAYWQHTETGEVTWEDPVAAQNYHEQHTRPATEEAHSEGDWTLYHDEQGTSHLRTNYSR